MILKKGWMDLFRPFVLIRRLTSVVFGHALEDQCNFHKASPQRRVPKTHTHTHIHESTLFRTDQTVYTACCPQIRDTHESSLTGWSFSIILTTQGMEKPTPPPLTKEKKFGKVCLLPAKTFDEGQITHLICARLKYDLYDFFRGCLGPASCSFLVEKVQKHPLKKSYRFESRVFKWLAILDLDRAISPI